MESESAVLEAPAPVKQKRKGGRPKGFKVKPKVAPVEVSPEPDEDDGAEPVISHKRVVRMGDKVNYRHSIPHQDSGQIVFPAVVQFTHADGRCDLTCFPTMLKDGIPFDVPQVKQGTTGKTWSF